MGQVERGRLSLPEKGPTLSARHWYINRKSGGGIWSAERRATSFRLSIANSLCLGYLVRIVIYVQKYCSIKSIIAGIYCGCTISILNKERLYDGRRYRGEDMSKKDGTKGGAKDGAKNRKKARAKGGTKSGTKSGTKKGKKS